MATAETEAIAYSLPAGSELTGDRRHCIPVTIVAGTNTAEIDLGYTLCWITITSSVDARMRSSEVVGGAAPNDNDFPIWAKSYQNNWVSTDRYLRFRGIADNGTLYIYVSNR